MEIGHVDISMTSSREELQGLEQLREATFPMMLMMISIFWLKSTKKPEMEFSSTELTLPKETL
jgi:hypothetical protein